MSELLLSKYEALGNDFLVVDGGMPGGSAPRTLCDRRRGVGADGILAVRGADLELLNADGSPADFSGNGIRCAALHVSLASGERTVQLRLGGREYRLEVEPTGGPEAEVSVEVRAADHRVEPAGPEVAAAVTESLGEELPSWLVDVGNPHLVLLPPSARVPPGEALDRLRHGVPGYDGGINVSWLEAERSDRARVHTWERGVGPTPSCASAAMACFLVGLGAGLFGAELQLHVPGGVLTLGGSAELVRLAGPVRRVHEARWQE